MLFYFVIHAEIANTTAVDKTKQSLFGENTEIVIGKKDGPEKISDPVSKPSRVRGSFQETETLEKGQKNYMDGLDFAKPKCRPDELV